MTRISTSKTRDIIPDFAREISKRKTSGPKPSKTVINFRNERQDGIERDVYWVPVELLRYRKDNGRISAEVATYEKEHALLDETQQEAQDVLRNMLKENDTEKNDELKYSMLHEGPWLRSNRLRTDTNIKAKEKRSIQSLIQHFR